MAFVFAIFSIGILYAEIANFIGFENNLIYDIVILIPDYDEKSASYFLANVNSIF